MRVAGWAGGNECGGRPLCARSKNVSEFPTAYISNRSQRDSAGPSDVGTVAIAHLLLHGLDGEIEEI